MLTVNWFSVNQPLYFNVNSILAENLVSSTMHLTSRVKLETEMGWSSIKDRADFLALTLFQKIHCNQLRPLIKSCMPLFSQRVSDQQKVTTYRQFPFKGVLFSNSFFPHITRKWNMLPVKLKTKIFMILKLI